MGNKKLGHYRKNSKIKWQEKRQAGGCLTDHSFNQTSGTTGDPGKAHQIKRGKEKVKNTVCVPAGSQMVKVLTRHAISAINDQSRSIVRGSAPRAARKFVITPANELKPWP